VNDVGTTIIHLRGSGLGVVVMIIRCTLRARRYKESSDPGADGPADWGIIARRGRWIVAAMDHRNPANRFGNSGRLSRVQPFCAWLRPLE
jgi:hypothetical protein